MARTPRTARKKDPRTRLDVDERRAQLLALGLDHFGRQPYDDVSIDAIAQAAGVSKGLLYHYFPTKKAFYAATVREAANSIVALCDRPDGDPPLQQLTDGIDAYLDFVREHRTAYATLMRSGVGVDREIAEIVDETREAFLALLTEGVFQAFPAGEPLTRSPLLDLALRGWVGLCEQVSLGWIDMLTQTPPRRQKRAAAASAPSQAQVRDLLAKALISIVTDAH
jgi:AcrR family transcriptional regulator